MLNFFLLADLNTPDFMLSDYRGSDSKFFSIIIILLAFFSTFSILLFIAFKISNFLQFNRICASSRLTRLEIGTLKQYMRKFHIRNTLELLSKQEKFDDLIFRLAHFFESQNLSERDLIEKGEFFHGIRKKLHFVHSKNTTSIKSTRSLKAGHIVLVTFTDPSTKNVFEFQAKVLYNTEFYLGIKPPKDEINKILFGCERAPIEVTFAFGEEKEYLFESRLIRLVNFPKIMWYIEHSKSLSEGDPQKSLELPGTVLVQSHGDDAKIEEMKIKVDALSNKNIIFCTVKQKDHKIELDHNILTSFHVDTSPITVRAKVISTFTKKGRTLYRCNLQDLSRDDEDRILRFVNKLKKQMSKNVG